MAYVYGMFYRQSYTKLASNNNGLPSLSNNVRVRGKSYQLSSLDFEAEPWLILSSKKSNYFHSIVSYKKLASSACIRKRAHNFSHLSQRLYDSKCQIHENKLFSKRRPRQLSEDFLSSIPLSLYGICEWGHSWKPSQFQPGHRNGTSLLLDRCHISCHRCCNNSGVDRNRWETCTENIRV